MKKHSYRAILGILLLLGGCKNLLSPGGGDSIPGNRGRLLINVESGARTALPTGAFDRYVLRFDYAGSGGHSHEPMDWRSTLMVDLEPGEWTITAEAYAGNTLSGIGRITATVVAGTSAPMTIRIGISPGEGITGTLRYKVSYPQGPEHRYGAQTMTLRATAGNHADITETISNGVEKTLSAPAGVYFVDVKIENTLQRTGVTRTVAAHIYGGRETNLEISISAEEFSALVPMSVTAGLTIPTGTVESRRIGAFYGGGFTELLGEADAPATSGTTTVTLWIPSGDVSPNMTIKLIQKIEVDGDAYKGPGTDSVIADPGQPHSFTIDDVYYRVETAPSITNGALDVKPLGIPPLNVELTADPDSGFVLNSRSLRYKQASDNTYHPIERSGDTYSFEMPESDVTIEGVFASLTRHVAPSPTGTATADGSSWTTASSDLQKMMDDLAELRADGHSGPFIVKLAAGTYTPLYKPMDDGTMDYSTPANDRDSTFMLRDGVEVLGGYPAGGGDTRNPQTNLTILSGNIGVPNNAADNTYHVVLATDDVSDEAVLDGLTITGGYADGSSNITVGGMDIYRDCGGGMYNQSAGPTLTNVTISGNHAAGNGGGMANYGFSIPVLTNVTISGNTSNSKGGGVYNHGSATIYQNVKIIGNDSANGGGIYDEVSNTWLTNVVISGNKATNNGGGIYNDQYGIQLHNVTIAGNLAGTNGGGGLYDSATYSEIRNSIIWGNVAGIVSSSIAGTALRNISNSIVQGSGGSGSWVLATGNDEGYNLDLDPFFVDWKDPNTYMSMPNSAGDYHLLPTSLAINRGDNDNYMSDNTTDLDGKPRIDGVIDMGAYEIGAAPEMVRYVVVSGAGTINGSSWANASGDLQMMMDELATLGGGVVKLGAGTYTPKYEPNSNGTTNYTPPSGSRDLTFILRPGVEVRGGYEGTPTDNPDEPTRKARFHADGTVINAPTHEAILSGEFGSSGSFDNAFHVVLGLNIPANSGTVLDGLTIDWGNADGTSIFPFGSSIDQRYGGGIYNHNSSPLLTNVKIGSNSSSGGGSGIYNHNSSPVLTNVTISGSGGSGSGSIYNNNSSPVLTNVKIESSTIGGGGGGIYNQGSSPVLTNVAIERNTAGGNGGGIYNNANSSPVLINVLISGNISGTTTANGGGIYNDNSSPVLINVTIAGNKANGSGSGGGIYNNDVSSNPQISNSIIWGNAAGTTVSGMDGLSAGSISHSIEEPLNGGGSDPLFESWINPNGGFGLSDYRLQSTSPAIDMGDDYSYPGTTEAVAQLLTPPLVFSAAAQAAINAALVTDLAGKVRRRDTIDMGAYENQAFYSSQDLAAIALIFDDRGSGTFSQDSFSISKVGTETRTITITGSGYSDPRWFVDGVEKAPGNSITLAATAYPLGGHSLSLWVVKNNRPWSKELAFTVVN